jgi:O-antigen/teichoic acid export membrane protein
MKKVSRNFLSLFISDGITRIIGLAATVYIARMLAVEGFGLISYGLAFMSYALLFANPGLTIIGTREVAKAPHDRRFIEEVLGLRLVLAVVMFAVFFAGTVIVPGDIVTKRVILVYALAFFPFAMLLEFVFQGREEMVYIGISRILQYAVYLIILVIFVRSTRDILIVPFSFIVGYVASALFLLVIYIKKYGSFRLHFSLARWRLVLAVSIPVGIAIIFNHATISLPPIVLGLFKSNYDVGIFSAAYKVVFTLLIIERVFYYVFFPVLSRQHAENPEKLKNNFSFLTRFLLALTIPLSVGGLMLAPGVVHMIFGPTFHDASNVLRVLLLYFVIVPVNTVYGYGLIAIDREKVFSRIVTITAVISAVLILLLGLKYGFYGAAFALLISESLSIFLMHRALRRVIQFESVRYALKPLGASVVMAVVLYLIQQWHLFAAITAGICAYLAVFYLIKGFSIQDLRNIKHLFRAG